MSCHNRRCQKQRCENTNYSHEQILKLMQEVSTLQQQMFALKERSEFVWCKLKPLLGSDVVDRLTAIEADITTLEGETSVLRECGILTFDCESSDSESSGSEDQFRSFIVSGTVDPECNELYSFEGILIDSIFFASSEGIHPVQRLSDEIWYIGTPSFGWRSPGGEAHPLDVTSWTALGGAVGTPVLSEA